MRSNSRRNDNSEKPADSPIPAARSAESATAGEFVSARAPEAVVSGGFARKRTLAAILACADAPCTILAPFRLRFRWLRISFGFIRNTRPFLISDSDRVTKCSGRRCPIGNSRVGRVANRILLDALM